MVLKLLEKNGIFIFLLSVLTITQLRWAQKYNYDDIALRITMCIIISIVMFSIVVKIIEKYCITYSNISFAMSFSVLGIYLNTDIELFILFTIILIIYMVRKFKYQTLFVELWGDDVYKIKYNNKLNKLHITNRNIDGVNVYKFKSAILDIINCIIACKENQKDIIYLESEEDREINGIIIDIFKYFDIEAKLIE